MINLHILSRVQVECPLNKDLIHLSCLPFLQIFRKWVGNFETKIFTLYNQVKIPCSW